MSNKSGLWNASFGEIGATLKVLEDAGVTLEKFASLRTDKKLAKKVAELIMEKAKAGSKVITATNEIKLVIDYKTTEQAIADGNYDWKNSDITAENFPVYPEMVGKKVEVATKLFHFNRDINSDAAISKMDKDGYRPATLMELLALGAANPDLQRQFPIVALGSVWHGAGGLRYVPCLDVGGSRRELGLSWFVSDWSAHCRFLGVRK